MRKVLLSDIGTTDYAYAWELQKAIHQARVSRKIPDAVILTEHFNTYTIGKSGGDDHLLASDQELREKNVEVYKIDRGGDITYHGPGQIVCYPIIDLEDYYRDVHRYLRDLEEVVIRVLGQYGIVAHREPEYTGVWVGSEKICAIGVKVSRWVTMHGFAFNINTDLSYFGRIIPCGIFHKGVTSLSQLLGRAVDMQEVKIVVTLKFAEVFQTEIVSVSPEQLIEEYQIVMEKEHASN